MSLTKTQELDKIELVNCGEWYIVQVREVIRVFDNGEEISRSNFRYSINPTDDWSDRPTDVQAQCNLFHTQERRYAYTAHINPPEPDDTPSAEEV